MRHIEYESYHIHSHLTNLVIPDSVVTKKDYAVAFQNMGNMHTLSTCEHGWQGDIYAANDICEGMRKSGYDIHPVQVSEAYFVKDRFEKDNTNAHLILIAVNEEGRQDLNAILSEANLTGFYYRARVDLPLLLSVNPQNLIVTTACIGGVWKYQEGMEYLQILQSLKDHFGKNFFLEVQPHNTESQKKLNATIKNLYFKGYQIIAATDSHFLNDEQDKNRTYYLESKGLFYEDEQGWDLSLPTGDELYAKFVKQGVLSNAQIEEAMKNTLILRQCNSVHNHTEYVLKKNKKIPNLMPEKSIPDRVMFCKRMMLDNYNQLYPYATPEEKERDFGELRYESQTIESVIDGDVPMVDYFLTLSAIINRGKELGGVITTSGRGSAVSFFTNHLLGMTSVNRITAPVHMYADRFISPDRVLSGSLPDIDTNLSNPAPFVQAAQELLGEWGILPMIAFGKLQVASAWKMYARANGVPADVANIVSKGLQKYDRALRYAMEESDDPIDEEDQDFGINLANYVPKEYMDMVQESKHYMGVIDNYSPHPCAHLLIQGDIRREIGVMRLKGNKGVTEVAAIIDGATAEKYGYLKVDLLRVDVVKVIRSTFDALGMEVPTENELLTLVDRDEGTWDMYKKGYTMGLNQVEKENTTARVMQYKPKNIVELTAFVAAVRPGFKSMLEIFISRNKFEYYIPALDKLLQSEEIPSSFLIFQEQVMTILQKAGISASESYNCIKAISKKNADKINSYKAAFVKGFTSYLEEDASVNKESALETTETVWGIIQDNSSYSFNISHAYCVALDSLYCAWLKAHHPYELYMTLLDSYMGKGTKDKIALLKNEMFDAYGIRIISPRFRMDNRGYVLNKENKTIVDALTSIKHVGKATAEALYNIRDIVSPTFADLLAEMEEIPCISKRHIDILIKTGYFEAFGPRAKLLAVHAAFKEGPMCYKKTYVEKTKQTRLEALRQYESTATADDLSPIDLVAFEIEHLGLPVSLWENSRATYAVVDVDDKYTPRIHLSSLSNEKTGVMKIRKKEYLANPPQVGDIVQVLQWKESKPFKTEDGFVVPPALWMEDYQVFSNRSNYPPEDLKRALGMKIF